MLNHIVIMGRLTKDPEARTTQSGINVTSFTVAVDRDYSGDGEKQTDFIVCTAWRGTADFVSRYFHKGSMIVVLGSLQSRKWQDNDGGNRISWEVNAQSCYFGEPKRSDGGDFAGYGGGEPREESRRAKPAGRTRNVEADDGFDGYSRGEPRGGYGGGYGGY